MKIFKIVNKDFREFYRESTTFKVVVISPIIIIAIFGFVFNKGLPSTINLPMKIGICSQDESIPTAFIEGLKEERWVQVEEIKTRQNCEEIVKNSISTGKYKGGIIIPQSFTSKIISGNKSDIKIYIDNSLIGIGNIMKGYLWRVVQKYSEKFKEDPMTSIRIELFNLSFRLKTIKDSISYSKIENLTSYADELNENVQSIDTQSYIENINDTILKLDNVWYQIDFTCNEIKTIREDINFYIEELKDIKSDLEDYDNEILEVKQVLESFYDSLCNYGELPPPPDTTELCDETNSTIEKLDQTHQDLQRRISMIDSIILNLEENDAKLKDKQIMLSQMKEDIENSKKSLRDVDKDFTYLNKVKAKTQSFSDQFELYSENIKREEMNLKSELDAFNENIDELLIGMSTLPMNPLNIEIKNIFEERSFLDFMIPSLISFLTMFISLFLSCTTIIREKNSGTLRRTLLTPTSLSTFICGKIISIILIGLIEISIILSIGAVVFHTVIPTVIILQLVTSIVLSLFAFTVIGMLIGIWSDSGTTAVLFGITLMIILIFISGMTIPNELLPIVVVKIGKYLPLSNVLSLFRGLFIYNVTEQTPILYLSILSIMGIIICVISIKKRF